MFAHLLLQELLDPTVSGDFHRHRGVPAERSAASGALRGGERAQVQPHLLPHAEL